MLLHGRTSQPTRTPAAREQSLCLARVGSDHVLPLEREVSASSEQRPDGSQQRGTEPGCVSSQVLARLPDTGTTGLAQLVTLGSPPLTLALTPEGTQHLAAWGCLGSESSRPKYAYQANRSRSGDRIGTHAGTLEGD